MTDKRWTIMNWIPSKTRPIVRPPERLTNGIRIKVGTKWYILHSPDYLNIFITSTEEIK